MAEPLKNQYTIAVAINIAQMLVHVYPNFAAQDFVDTVNDGYDELELMDRGRKIAQGLVLFLPSDFKQAVSILLASLDAPLELDPNNSIASFIFMPHTIFVSEQGLDDFDTSMLALYQLTQRFTSEFAIRPFIQRYPEKTLALLSIWAEDDNMHVRRLVSEGTRPRLPWAARLPEFIRDPAPVVQLLDKLKNDPELYVRRSVANNLNDIGKDHPRLLASLAKNWLKAASKERQWLVKHGLRSAVKRGELGALEALGYSQSVDVKVHNVSIAPEQAKMGGSIQLSFELTNQSSNNTALMVDFNIHFVKANGLAKPKVCKLKAVELAPEQSCLFSKTISLKPMTTRTLYSGKHKIELLINGQTQPLGAFTLS